MRDRLGFRRFRQQSGRRRSRGSRESRGPFGAASDWRVSQGRGCSLRRAGLKKNNEDKVDED